MHITITGRKVNLKNNFKELVEKKLSRYDRIFEENADAHVVVTVEHNRQTVEITIRQSGLIFRAEATDFEMNDALDQVISALGRQIRKNKTKLERCSSIQLPTLMMNKSYLYMLQTTLI